MSTHGSSIWQRLRDNGAANSPVFQHARIEQSDITTLTCPDCGFEESALFWTPAHHSPKAVLLTCPLCGREGARYDLRRNRGRPPYNVRRALMYVGAAVLLGISVNGAVHRYAPPPDQMEFRLEQARRQVARAPAAILNWVSAQADRISDAVFDRR
ncbi:MAG TPA: hypothetical protein VK929_06595 [Longimicrobiales bacterium]|nr:hypothetical protein [Longimicrobiales bacterium]